MIPKRLKKGDVIGIVSPSDPVAPEQRVMLGKGIVTLESLGFRIELANHVFSNTLGYAATPQEKADDLNEMFKRTEISAIFCSQGGDSANGCLPFLDWNLIKANPKIFMGMSDITVLLNALYAKTGLVTFHGSDVLWGFGRKPPPYSLDEFQWRLTSGRSGLIPPSNERKTVRSGCARGKLIGGNLRCLLKLSGTPYFPDTTGAVLFFEALSISPQECHSLFHQLRQMGAFDKVAGVIIGYVYSLQKTENAYQMESILLEVTADMYFPILKTNDFGHNCPSTVMPVGYEVQFDADSQEIIILEPCVL